jgi:hypothetical protein
VPMPFDTGTIAVCEIGDSMKVLACGVVLQHLLVNVEGGGDGGGNDGHLRRACDRGSKLVGVNVIPRSGSGRACSGGLEDQWMGASRRRLLSLCNAHTRWRLTW